MIVDDDADIRELIAHILEREGFTTLGAGDGRAALALALKRHPALVILDLQLPVIGGEVIAGHLHAIYGRSIPILVVSAEPEAEEVAAQIGAIACLPKPFDPPDLLSFIRYALARGVAPRRVPSATSRTGGYHSR